MYLVLEAIDLNLGKSPTYRLESGYVILKGFAGDKQWGFYIQSNINTLSTGVFPDVFFNGDYDVNSPTILKIGQRTFDKVISTAECCLTGQANCYQPSCSG